VRHLLERYNVQSWEGNKSHSSSSNLQVPFEEGLREKDWLTSHGWFD